MKTIKQFLQPRLIFNILGIIVLAMTLPAGGNSNVAAKTSSQEESSKAATSREILAQCVGPDGRSSSDPLTGKVNFAGASPSSPLQDSVNGMQFASPEAAARGYLTDCGTLFGLKDQANELAVTHQRKTNDGRSVVRFQQNYQGIPVFGGELLVQLTTNNQVILVNGSMLPDIKLNTEATVDAATAQAAALQKVADQHQVNLDALKVSDAQLWIYSPKLVESRSGSTSLVWRMEVTPKELAPIRELLLINAQDGSVVLDVNQVDTALNRETYTAANTTTRPGTLVCNESDPGCTNGGLNTDLDSINAHVYAGQTYDFYFNHHSRDSIDNAGMTLISTVHFSTNYCNAFWDGVQMTYGDGCFIVADDVVAHELTHGVTENESGLFYAFQSGAINESFSDIWGEFVDQTNGVGTDTPAVKWLMGEDTSIGALRNMKDPTAFGDPDKMSGYVFGLNGDVHWNSGIGNKTAYLITDGDTFNGQTITGIGITKAADIYYEAQTNILVSTSNYHSLFDALAQACTNLIGTDGITSGDCTEVVNATLATELDLLPVPPSAPSNDDFSSPIVISSLPYTNTQNDLSTATMAVDDPFLPCTTSDSPTNSVWYDFTATESGTLSVDTSGYDTILGIWTGASPAALTSVACNDDIDATTYNYHSKSVFSVAAGQTYHIEVAGYYGAENLTINVSFTSAPVTIAPTGSILDTTPTYKWSKIPGATQYRYQLMKGASTIYTKTVAGTCGVATCTNTPTQVLVYATYKWRVQAQISGVWKSYSAYNVFKVTPPPGPFNSQFTSNASGWTPVNGTWSVTGGNYTTTGIPNNFVSSAHTGKYSKFTFETKVKRSGACVSCSNAIYFRGIPSPLASDGNWDKGFYFTYANDGYWSFWYVENGSWFQLVSWRRSSAIVKKGWNTLKVAASGTHLQLYINGVMVTSGVATGFNPSGYVGTGLYAGTGASEKLYVDWATLNLSGLPYSTVQGQSLTTFDLSKEQPAPAGESPFFSPEQ